MRFSVLPDLVWMCLVALDVWASPASGLLCYCTDGEMCDIPTGTCRTKDSAACVTYVYVVGNTEQRALLCSESGYECPRDGDPPGKDGSRMYCCGHDFCNVAATASFPGGSISPASTDAPITSTAVATTSPVAARSAPPASQTRLRCDCTANTQRTCRADRGGRGQHHCAVTGGWCVAEARRSGPAAADITVTRFCTTDRDYCVQAATDSSNVQCCSESRYCNEQLVPSFDRENFSNMGNTASIRMTNATITATPGGELQAPVTSSVPGVTLPVPAGNSTDGVLPSDIWCHCNTPLQCNKTFPFCRTAGKCQAKQHILPFETTRHCVEPNNDHLCTDEEPCCTEDCCNGPDACTPHPRPTVQEDVTRPNGVYMCHCSNCASHECQTRLGCIVNIDTMTNTSEQDCIRSPGSSHVHCSPSFSSSVASSRIVGNTHSFCCHGDKCNAYHPSYPKVPGNRVLFCHCKGRGCTFDTVCSTTLHGGQCYTGDEGHFCIEPGDKRRLARLCSRDKKCCNTSYCNNPASTPGGGHSSTRVVSPTPRTPPTGQSTSGDRSATTDSSTAAAAMPFSILYVGVALAVFFLLCVVLLLVLIARTRLRQASLASGDDRAPAHCKPPGQARAQAQHGHCNGKPTPPAGAKAAASPACRPLSAWACQGGGNSVDGGSSQRIISTSTSSVSVQSTATSATSQASTQVYLADSRHSSSSSVSEAASAQPPQARPCTGPPAHCAQQCSVPADSSL